MHCDVGGAAVIKIFSPEMIIKKLTIQTVASNASLNNLDISSSSKSPLLPGALRLDPENGVRSIVQFKIPFIVKSDLRGISRGP